MQDRTQHDTTARQKTTYFVKYSIFGVAVVIRDGKLQPQVPVTMNG